jgi:hypothetical protein
LPSSYDDVMATVTCPGCLERDERIAALERRVAELEARLGTNATNSGLPPSANPPSAPKPVTKKRTGKKPGGQPGHPPLLRDFQKLVDRGGAAAPLGRPLPRVAERLFVEWHLFRGGGCDQQELQLRLDGPARAVAASTPALRSEPSSPCSTPDRPACPASGPRAGPPCRRTALSFWP